MRSIRAYFPNVNFAYILMAETNKCCIGNERIKQIIVIHP